MSSSVARQFNTIGNQTELALNEGQFQSYSDMREALIGMGAKSSTVDQLTIPALTAVLEIIRDYSMSSQVKRGPGRPKREPLAESLSVLDRRIVGALLSSTGTLSSSALSKQLGVPLSTVHRRRKWLEAHMLDRSYTLKAESLGLKTTELFISTKNVSTSKVARELLELRDVILFVWRIMSESGIDLEAKVIFRDHEDLANILERINSIDAIDRVHWYNHIEVIGKNDYPLSLV